MPSARRSGCNRLIPISGRTGPPMESCGNSCWITVLNFIATAWSKCASLTASRCITPRAKLLGSRLTFHTAPLWLRAHKVRFAAAGRIAWEHLCGEDLPQAVRTSILPYRCSGAHSVNRDTATVLQKQLRYRGVPLLLPLLTCQPHVAG